MKMIALAAVMANVDLHQLLTKNQKAADLGPIYNSLNNS
jgi:hypothetical protein